MIKWRTNYAEDRTTSPTCEFEPCKDFRIVPTSVRIKPPVLTPKGWKLAKNVGFQLLRIAEIHSKIRALTREEEFLSLDFLRSRLTATDLEQLVTLVQELQHEEDCKVKVVHSKKLLAVTRSQRGRSQMTRLALIKIMGVEHLQ